MLRISSYSDFLMKLIYTKNCILILPGGPILNREPSLLFHRNGPGRHSTCICWWHIYFWWFLEAEIQLRRKSHWMISQSNMKFLEATLWQKISNTQNQVRYDKTKHTKIQRYFIKKKRCNGLINIIHVPLGTCKHTRYDQYLFTRLRRSVINMFY